MATEAIAMSRNKQHEINFNQIYMRQIYQLHAYISHRAPLNLIEIKSLGGFYQRYFGQMCNLLKTNTHHRTRGKGADR